ncbi:unnamed protein product [Microthlaspi erraticum]|uniref:Reverse transcriptase zinc-binding domain-containing protein n=1 Tax=Microthlaspi erraticum TaxID=1685480 RepID=A0A6D2J7S3_9BRAS|nr:unnamed protein product [Microthlaspi erraticum]
MGPTPEFAKDLKVADLLLPQSRGWNEDLINTLLPCYKEEILCIVPGSFDTEDCLAWLPQMTGEYSVKTGYYAARDRGPSDLISAVNNNFNWISEVWGGNFAPKLKIFLWKAVQGALPLGENLAIRGIVHQATCIHCGQAETTLHIFFLYEFAQEVWRLAPFRNQFTSGTLTNIKAGIKILNVAVSLPQTGIGAGTLAPWIMWSIWMSRNNKIFNNRRFNVQETLNLASIRGHGNGKRLKRRHRSAP